MQARDFIAKWAAGGTAHGLNERAGAQAHFIDLCRLLGVPEPGDPANYCFERVTKTGLGRLACRHAHRRNPAQPARAQPGSRRADLSSPERAVSAMKLHFNCRPLSASPLAEPLVFSWDPEAGTVDGPDADRVRAMAAGFQVAAHPLPWAWRLSAEPLKNWTDMAAIVGGDWHLPPELLGHYPVYKHPPQPTDHNGNPLDGFVN